jgi:hypothetical protein
MRNQNKQKLVHRIRINNVFSNEFAIFKYINMSEAIFDEFVKYFGLTVEGSRTFFAIPT